MKNPISYSLTIFALLLSNVASSQNYYFENFETQPITAPTDNSNSCSNANWPLANGLVNASNDDIEWLVLTGSTTIYAASGPLVDFDHTLGTNAGKYICITEADDCFNEIAHLETPNIDLTNAVNPTLTFWYHLWDEFPNQQTYGNLNVDVFSNGIWTYAITPSIFGNYGNQWQERQVSLAAYVGQNIKIRFRGITGDFSYVDISLDDIMVSEQVTGTPNANFSLSLPICSDGTTFTDNSSNSPSSWNWTFGADASPQTAIGPGPHAVMYSSTSPQTVTLVVSNSLGSSTISQNVQPIANPSSNFSFTSIAETFSFFNLSSNANTFSWDFGDGTPPNSFAGPDHTYTIPGTYNVTLYASNQCGTDSSTQVVTTLTGTDDLNRKKQVEISPNPSNQYFTISSSELRGDVEVQLFGIDGKSILYNSYKINSHVWSQTIDVSELPAGSYILRLTDKDQSLVRKLLVE